MNSLIHVHTFVARSMSERKYRIIRGNMRPIYTLVIVLASSMLLASCGGGGGSSTDQVSSSSVSEDGRMKALAVPGTWTGRVPPINTSGSIPFDPNKLDSASKHLMSSGTSLADIVGFMPDQFWIATSLSMSQAAALAIANKLQVIAWRDSMGLLVERGINTSPDALTIVKSTPGVYAINNRAFKGAGIVFDPQAYPNDGGSPFGDATGDNWHIDHAKIGDVWNTLNETGNSQVAIGVFDTGFINDQHEDLIGSVVLDLTSSSVDYNRRIHGNMVVSTLAARTGNGVGVSGINWASKVKIGSPIPNDIDGSLTAAAFSGVINNSNLGLTRVVNFSLGRNCRDMRTGSGCPTAAEARSLFLPLKAAFSHIRNNDVLKVVAAGNNGRNANTGMASIQYNDDGSFQPMNDVIVVAALRKTGHLAPYSNYGESVDLAAPTEFKAARDFVNGVSQYATTANGFIFDQSTAEYGNDLGFSGASAATPVVTGIASLMFSRNQALTAAQAKKILISTSDRIVGTRHSFNASGETLPLPDNRTIPVVNAFNAVKSALPIVITASSVSGVSRVNEQTTIVISTDQQRATAQKIEISVDGGVFEAVFDRANGIRDSSGVWQSDIHTFTTQRIFSSDGDRTLTIKATDLLGRIDSIQLIVSVLPASIPDLGLVGHWSFDNCDARDSSPNALNGTKFGAPACVPGKYGSAYRMNGTSDYFTVPTAAAMPSMAVTMSYWLNREGRVLGSFENYISKELSFQAYLLPNGTSQFGVWLGVQGLWTGWGSPLTVLPSLTDWVHYTFTYDSTTRIANTYINGVLVQSVFEPDARAVVRASGYPMYIGRNGSANVYHIRGLIDEVRIYNRALTSDEVRLLAR